jgi:hypothetical protein
LRHPRALALLILAALAHGLILWRASAHLVDLDHDSVIAHLAATGHQRAYAETVAGGATTAGAIQRLLRVEKRWPLRRIADDLARTDIHPPLYFWRLHAQLLAADSSPRAYLLLNGAIGLLTILLLFFTGRRLWDASAGAAAAALWAVGDGVLQSALHARPYALLALIALLLVRLAIAVLDRGGRPGPGWIAALALTLLLGGLTHYHFPIVVAAVGVALALQGESGRRAAYRVLALALVAAALAALLHPGFAASLERSRLQAQPFDPGGALRRVAHFARGLQGLVHPHATPASVAAPAALLLALAIGRAVRSGALARLGTIRDGLGHAPAGVRFVAIAALAIVTAKAVLYVGHVSPFHATGGRYHAELWPLFALLAAGAARWLTGDRLVVPLIALGAGVVVFHTAARLDDEQRGWRASAAWRELARARVVVADHDGRGILPRALVPVPPATPVRIVRDRAGAAAAFREVRALGGPVTLLLHPESGAPALREALGAGEFAGSLAPAGTAPGGAEVVIWTPQAGDPDRAGTIGRRPLR